MIKNVAEICDKVPWKLNKANRVQSLRNRKINVWKNKKVRHLVLRKLHERNTMSEANRMYVLRKETLITIVISKFLLQKSKELNKLFILNLILFMRMKIFNMRVWSWLRMNAGGALKTCKSNGNIWLVYFSEYFSGGRVSNTWATCLQDWDNRGKLLLIPDMTTLPHGREVKGAIHLKMGSRLIS